MFLTLKDNLFHDEEYNFYWKISDYNYLIVLLVLFIYLIIVIIEINFKLRLNLLLVFLFYLIMVRNLLIFFLLYEMVFILIIFVILLLGYSYERLIAAFLIIFYSFLFSRPVLIIILLFEQSFLIKEWLNYSFLIIYFFVGAFIVKFPVFGFHYWLPVAHVEASTIGSILLAGLLLKLGAVGALYIVIYLKFIVKCHWIVVSITILILIILSIRDLKIIIAYSSVAHITIVFYVLILGFNIGKKGSIYIMFYHGFISPLMFWVVGILAWWKTRSLIVIKSIIFSYIFVLMLFFLFILNISFPPFLGFLREILILKAVLFIPFVLILLILRILMSCYYNIYLFWCFNGVVGLLFKINFFIIDLFLFLLLSLILNFY